MIQRQQSLWLLLSAVASFLSFKLPFYTGNKLENNISVYAELDGASNFLLLVATGASVLIAAIAIFMYKDRKTQLKLSITGIGISILLLILYFSGVKNFEDAKGRFSITAILVIAVLAGYIMATRGIWKDEKLVKSLDKLR